jgi:glycosyltransferase involved in cell wall biosynthesis
MTPPDVSAVVCTYDRPELLRRALASLLTQTLAPERFEIVVVDNGPDAAVASVVERLGRDVGSPPVVVVRESSVGSGHARNAGVAASQGRYVAFIDDDATAAPDWLQQALEDFESIEPTPVAVGGPVETIFDVPPPSWFREEWERRSHGTEPRFLRRGEVFSGSNMIVARRTVIECGGFDVSVGMRGLTIGTAEETELFHAIWRADPDAHLYYDPALRVAHPVAPYKLSARYQLKREFADGQSRERARRRSRRESLSSLPRYVAALVRSVALALVSVPSHRVAKVWAVEGLRDVARNLGRLHAALGFKGGVRRVVYDAPPAGSAHGEKSSRER